MKKVILPIIGIFVVSIFGYFQYSYAMCAVNEDWPDAPCMDMIMNRHYPQAQVDMWSAYYDYKGAEFMEAKKAEMNQAIQNDNLKEWIDESIQNYNVWTYYYFSGEAPRSHPYHAAAFELITRDRMPLQNLVSMHNPFWYDPQSWIITVIVGSAIGTPLVMVWRKRK